MPSKPALQWCILLLLLLSGIQVKSNSTTYQVPADFPTIQEALNSAVHGDEIVVAPGTYSELIKFKGKNVILRSIDPEDYSVIRNTILKGSYSQWTVSFTGDETADCVLTGFTITGGSGGVSGKGCWATVKNNLVVKNQGVSQGAINDVDGRITNNIIAFNEGLYNAAGLLSCDGLIEQNVIYGHTGHLGRPISGIGHCKGAIRNCVVWANGDDFRTDIVSSASPTYCCIKGWTGGGVGNISADPRFINPASMEFRLFPNSPCIDAGGVVDGVTSDLDGNPRPFDALSLPRGDGSDYDIGAFEFSEPAVVNRPPFAPSHAFPRDGGDNISPIGPLMLGDFDDPDLGDMLSAVQWQISRNQRFSGSIFEATTEGDNAAVLRFSPGNLKFDTLYWWRARAYDAHLSLSPWSNPTSFRTRIIGSPHVVDVTLSGSIQAEIDAATDSDILIVPPGHYHESLYFGGKDIVLRSTDPLDEMVVENTILDGNREFGMVYFSGSESEKCELAGFHIRRGLSGVSGNHTRATIRRNRILWNHGGGIADCNGLIEGNHIAHNSYTEGGGLRHCNGLIQNNIILENTTYRHCGYYTCWSGKGGGLYECNGIVRNNTIVGNISPDFGGGLSNCGGILSNNIIWANEVIWSSQPEGGNQLFECATPEYSCIQDWSGGGTGNQLVEPRFVDSASGDYSLRPDSPCIDAGRKEAMVISDFSGRPRPFDSVASHRGDGSDYDIGAYEFQNQGVPDNPPFPPIPLSPINLEQNITLFPRLQVAPFVDLDQTDRHFATQWQLDDGTGGDTLLVDSGIDRENLGIYLIGPDTHLEFNTVYFWRARFMDTRGKWSDWSELGSFHTRNRSHVHHVPDQFPTVQSALDSSIEGDEIIVDSGIHYGPIVFPGHNVLLRSATPEDQKIVASTILSGSAEGFSVCGSPRNGLWPVVEFKGSESKECLLTGFTITKGASPVGGGIRGNGTLATIRGNIIVNNRSGAEPGDPDHLGGGIYGCDGTIEKNRIEFNQANIGGGLYGCDGIIRANVIRGNVARACYRFYPIPASTKGEGGGLSNCNGEIINNLIYDNEADEDGGGIHSCGGLVLSNTIYGNQSEAGPGLFDCWGTVRNSVIWANGKTGDDQIIAGVTPSNCCIQDWQGGGEGNIAIDPDFVDPPNGDFQLRLDSPCIDAGGFIGGLKMDFGGNPRPVPGVNEPRGDGTFFDIGAFEFQWPINSDSDFDGNQQIDYLDLFMFAPSWEKEMDTPVEIPNLNGDFVVNALDLLVLMKDWREATGPE